MLPSASQSARGMSTEPWRQCLYEPAILVTAA